MVTYTIEYEKKDLFREDSKPHGPYRFNVEASDICQAAILAVPELLRVGIRSTNNDVWNASVRKHGENDYKILRAGEWLVEFGTGKLKNIEDLV